MACVLISLLRVLFSRNNYPRLHFPALSPVTICKIALHGSWVFSFPLKIMPVYCNLVSGFAVLAIFSFSYDEHWRTKVVAEVWDHGNATAKSDGARNPRGQMMRQVVDMLTVEPIYLVYCIWRSNWNWPHLKYSLLHRKTWFCACL